MDISLIRCAGHGAGNHGNVVDAARINCGLDQGMGCEGGIVSVRVRDLQEALVRQHVAEAVGTEQQQIAGAEFERKEIAVHGDAKPYRPG